VSVSVFNTVASIASNFVSSAATQDVDGAIGFEHARLLRIVRISRLLRVLRMARVVRFVRPLRVLIHSMLTTVKSLVWIFLLVVLVLYFFAILFTQGVSDFLISDSHARMNSPLVTFWGTLPDSMLTLFKVMTGGVDWEVISTPLARLGAGWVFLFIFFVCFEFFALLNVITGVYCQMAYEGAQQDKELMIQELLNNKRTHVENTRELFTKMFASLDSDDSGSVNMEEFQEHIANESVQAFFALLELESTDAFTLFQLLDADGGGNIDAEEFVTGCIRLKGHARSIDLVKLTYEMRWFIRYFVQFVKSVGPKLSLESRLEQDSSPRETAPPLLKPIFDQHFHAPECAGARKGLGQDFQLAQGRTPMPL
jgi:hypothetical protein